MLISHILIWFLAVLHRGFLDQYYLLFKSDGTCMQLSSGRTLGFYTLIMCVLAWVGSAVQAINQTISQSLIWLVEVSKHRARVIATTPNGLRVTNSSKLF